MPSVSGPQHRAMEAAAHGHSTLGIPKSVGQDFVNADKGKKFAKGGTVKPDFSDMDAALQELGKTRQGPPPPKPPPKPPIKTSENEDSHGQGYNMGGEIGSIPTTGTSSSYPPPPDGRKQGPRNYAKKG